MRAEADEALARLAEHSRATIEDFLDRRGHLDILLAKRRGKLHLAKRYSERVLRTRTKDETTEDVIERRLELHDAQAALVKLLEAAGVLRWELKAPKSQEEFQDRLLAELQRIFGPEKGLEMARQFGVKERVH